MKPLSLSRPHLIVMIGIPGAGKSAFGERFAETFKAPLVSPGVLHQELFGVRYGKPATESKAANLAELMLNELLKTNQTIVFEEMTGSRHYRQELAKIANKAGYNPLFVWVQTDSGEASRRSLRRTKDNPGMTQAQFDDIVARFNVPVASEQAIVISGKHTYASQLKNVLKNMTTERAKRPVTVPRRNIKVE